MSERFFRSADGRYLGAISGFQPKPVQKLDSKTGKPITGDDGEPVMVQPPYVWPDAPAGGIEVPVAPENASAMWVDGRWVMPLKDYAELRREAYVAAGVTMEAIAEALIEHAGGKSQKLQQLMLLRDAVRTEIPKP